MNWKRQKRTQSVLGLTLDNGRLEAVWLRSDRVTNPLQNFAVPCTV